MKVLLPISLDRWRNPISTLQRACVRYNPEIEFHSFSNPVSDEDRREGEEFWKLPNLVLREPVDIARDRFDIVHTASYSHGNYVASVAAKLRGVGHTRYLDTMNLEQHPDHPVCWARYRRVLRWVDAFVAVSEAVAVDIRNRVPERFLGVIPNGFDPALYDPAIDCDADLPAEVCALPRGFPLWVAAIEPRKHPEVFVNLARKNPDIPFVALGGGVGDLGKSFEEDFRNTPNIHWLGNVDRKAGRAVLGRAGVLVFPSEREGLSLAMIEAVAMGVPILAQPKSSMPELVEAGQNGELVAQEDEAGWNDALHKWLGERSAAQMEALAVARQRAIGRFNWATVGAAYGPMYRRTLELPVRLLHGCPA
ncbi:glycosyltransferase family 4 protein [Luteolibacter ambystomatis]|uniref:Glycosyltransferase family 4 protein n=1 Tax=Luteolibacter ambystomatis TaxID=2824561 RepID=A0A975G7K9_9BACT|nr:glycosyltransferase family 4 protein [Luteolibacter ambystomatis]QUE50225.1 glycosyltransferase family 4 protein [Luteolibacter ambystomatis]